MTPGLARGPPFPPKATKGAIVAIASLDKPSVPSVVGICENDVASLEQVQGAKGHAVRSEHWFGDEVWGWSSIGGSGGGLPDRIEGWEGTSSDSSLHQQVGELSVEDDEDEAEEGGVRLDPETEERVQNEPRNAYVDGEDAEAFERVQEKELSTKGRIDSVRIARRESC